MSTNYNIIKLKDHPHLRARIVWDETPHEPYNDGGSPILRIHPHGDTVEQVTSITSYVLPERVVDAAYRWRDDLERFERYMRAFHGTTAFTQVDRDGNTFLTFDTAHWRDAMGLTDEHMAAHPEIDFGLANMDEYVAYLDGEAYGIMVEQRTPPCECCGRRGKWETIDSLWGIYDADYAEDEAKRMLTGEADDASHNK